MLGVSYAGKILPPLQSTDEASSNFLPLTSPGAVVMLSSLMPVALLSLTDAAFFSKTVG